MKTIHKTIMESFEGATLKALNEKFNTTMSWVARTADKYDKPVVDLELLRGYVIYETSERIPECIKDELAIRGKFPRCPECKHYTATDFRNGECPYVRGRLRNDDDVCKDFFEAWEAGDDWFKEGEKKKYERCIEELGCQSIRSA